MATIRAQVRLPYFSNDPADVATNTLHFQVNATPVPPAVIPALHVAINDFYDNVFEDGFMSPVVDLPLSHVRYYDLSQPAPRPPIAELAMTWPGGPFGSFGLPEENAVVLSFQGAPAAGVSQARRRGRIYLGPLSVTTLTGGVAADFARVNPAFISDIAFQAVQLHDAALTNETNWVIFSPTSGAITDVDNGWIDNGFDTQRRRGWRPITRTEWATL